MPFNHFDQRDWSWNTLNVFWLMQKTCRKGCNHFRRCSLSSMAHWISIALQTRPLSFTSAGTTGALGGLGNLLARCGLKSVFYESRKVTFSVGEIGTCIDLGGKSKAQKQFGFRLGSNCCEFCRWNSTKDMQCFYFPSRLEDVLFNRVGKPISHSIIDVLLFSDTENVPNWSLLCISLAHACVKLHEENEGNTQLFLRTDKI